MKKLLHILFFLTSFLSVKAQPGSLDLSFDSDGIAMAGISATNRGRALVIQTDGKIVLAGYSYVSSYEFALIRVNTNGSLDNSFSIDGKQTTDISAYDDYATCMALQGDGKILVAGYAQGLSDFEMTRYNIDGSLDNTFDGDGKVTTTIGSVYPAICNSIAIQSDGKIILAGSFNLGLAIVRYNTDGSLDNTFDSDGIESIYFPFVGVVNSIAVQPDGKILLAGYTYSGSNNNFAIVRINIDGSLDNTFDGDGKATTDFFGFDDKGYSMKLQSDGKILVSGFASTSASVIDFALVRYNSDGSLDNSFDLDGKVVTDFAGSQDYCYSMALQSDGKITMAGSVVSSITEFGIIRYDSTGSLDLTFDVDGKVTTSLGTNCEAYAIGIQSDDKIVVGGNMNPVGISEFTIARYSSTPLKINENMNNSQLKIFPNPTSSKINLSFNKNISNASLKITNSTGQLIFTQQNLSGNNFTFDVSTFANGIYFLELNDGEIISRTKFIKTN